MDLQRPQDESRSPDEQVSTADLIRRAGQEREDWYRDLVEHCQDLLCVHDLQGRLLLVNPAPARVLGYSVEELLQIPIQKLIDAEFRKEVDAYLSGVERSGETHGLMAVVTRAGERRIWEYRSTLRTEGVASPVVRAVARDVTEQKRADKQLREASEQLLATALEREQTIRDLKLFRALVDQSNDAIEVVDPETLRFLDVNEKACRDLGYSREELLSLRVFDVDQSVDQSRRSEVKKQLQERGLAIGERVHRRKDGSTFPVEINITSVQLDRTYNVVVARDITERKRAEEKLREYEKAMEGLDEMIVVLDRDYRYVVANRAFLKNRGLEKEQVLGRSLPEMLNPGVFEGVVKERLDECFRGKVVRYDMKYKYPLLGERDLSVSYFPIEGSNGIDRVACVLQDITERKQAQDALRRSEDNYRNFVAQSSEGIFRQDLDAPIPIDLSEDELVHHILHDSYMAECNDAMVKMYGLSSVNDFLGKRLTETLDPNDPRNIELTREYIRSGFRVLERMSHETDVQGNPKVFRNSMIGIVENGMLVCTWGIQRDITEKIRLDEARRKAEDALRQSEERFRVALKNSPITVFHQDRDLRYVWIYNPHLYANLQVLGKTDDEIMGPERAASLNEFKRGVLESGVGVRQEIVVAYNGHKYALDVNIEPLRDSDGTVVGITGSSMDIAKIRELADRLQEQKNKLVQEKLYLEKEIHEELGFQEIIGESAALKDVLKQARVVAPLAATVLLLGETGTGKELIARSLHHLSPRHDKNFIKLNCAAVPAGLLESELFGHEKGAFTGAVSQKIGRMELADKGTLFLDEIGELPLELQPKLLRVLQDQEFERLGGVHTLHVDVRIISATNRDLMGLVLEKKFREDLFYRLNVFPIRLPALRERRSDIPLLVNHFLRKHTARMNKRIESVPEETLEALINWDWPGNVRELENLIERLVILHKGPVLILPPTELEAIQEDSSDGTLDGISREHIVRVLRETNGILSGPSGAAVRLGLKRTTLQSMLKRLNIEPREYSRVAAPPSGSEN